MTRKPFGPPFYDGGDGDIPMSDKVNSQIELPPMLSFRPMLLEKYGTEMSLLDGYSRFPWDAGVPYLMGCDNGHQEVNEECGCGILTTMSVSILQKVLDQPEIEEDEHGNFSYSVIAVLQLFGDTYKQNWCNYLSTGAMVYGILLPAKNLRTTPGVQKVLAWASRNRYPVWFGVNSFHVSAIYQISKRTYGMEIQYV